MFAGGKSLGFPLVYEYDSERGGQAVPHRHSHILLEHVLAKAEITVLEDRVQQFVDVGSGETCSIDVIYIGGPP